jgi:hypothetical protein
VRIDTLFIRHVELARQAIIAYQVAAVEPYRQRIAAERLVPSCCWALRVNMEMGFVAVPGIADKTNERSSVHQLLRAQQWVSSQPHRRTNWAGFNASAFSGAATNSAYVPNRTETVRRTPRRPYGTG